MVTRYYKVSVKGKKTLLFSSKPLARAYAKRMRTKHKNVAFNDMPVPKRTVHKMGVKGRFKLAANNINKQSGHSGSYFGKGIL